MKTTHEIITGDSRQMNIVPDEVVHLIVTSPPYWQLKDYGTDNQIGFHDSYESYINHLNLVWKECYRVLQPGCRMCVNIGDQFARSVYYGRYKVIPIRTEIIKFCETIGFDYMGAIIWQKITTTNTTGGGALMGSFPYPRNGILKLNYEFILIFKKLGDPPYPSKEQKERSAMTKDEWKTWFSGNWQFVGSKQSGHIAMFPEELPRRLIKMFTFVEETVLDPFLGSGTTSLAAKNAGRHSVGYEINPEYVPIIRDKLNISQIDFAETEYVFTTDPPTADFNVEIGKLPYIFRDPLTFNKKMDIKKRQYGSKLDNRPEEKIVYYGVKEVISPELIRLSNGSTIRLLGIKEKESVREKAILFLQEKTKKQRVFIKEDKKKPDDPEYLSCYLYLKNKTFINAHLIKNGLADADTDPDYKWKNKFIGLQEVGKKGNNI